MPVLWQDKMSVGNRIIDDEHKYLFCLINSVEVALNLEDNERVLKMLFDQLEQYTKDHFKQEEKVQIKLKYAGYFEHKGEHQRILENIAELKKRLFEPEDDAVSLFEDAAPKASAKTAAEQTPPAEAAAENAELEDYDPQQQDDDVVIESDDTAAKKRKQQFEEVVPLLKSWILDHVLQTDMKMKKFLERLPNNFA